MPKFLFQVRYNDEALKGIMREGGSTRRAVADDLAKRLGGGVEAFYFAFGEVDAYVIADLPDNHAAARLAMTVSSSGRVTLTTVPLLTVDDLDAIAAASDLEYRAPGG